MKSIVNGEASAWNMSDMSKMLMTRPLSKNTQFDLQIPITQAGNYSLSFNANMELVKQGDSAYISVPKTVFEYGEDFQITYNIFDATNITDNTAWIAIAGSVGNEELYAKWGYINSATGAVTAQTSNTISYKILQGNAQFYSDGKFDVDNFLTDPISITILPPSDSVLNEQGSNGSANLSRNKRIYKYGDPINITYKTNTTLSSPWLTITDISSSQYGRWTYIPNSTEETINNFAQNNAANNSGGGGQRTFFVDDSGDFRPGYYQVVIASGGTSVYVERRYADYDNSAKRSYGK